MATYRGCTLTRTSTTTDVMRMAFGRPYRTIGHIWRITGRLTTEDGRGQRWLTSAAACREWIRAADAWAEDAREDARRLYEGR